MITLLRLTSWLTLTCILGMALCDYSGQSVDWCPRGHDPARCIDMGGVS